MYITNLYKGFQEGVKQMNYVKYNRSFVMMEEQGSQFAAKESVPIKGYLKVETGNNKGALRCVVQNLRHFDRGDYIYKLILFGKKGERTIHATIGNLVVNKQGNGETYFRFLPIDVDGKGNSFHSFTTAIVAAASTNDDKEPLHPVLKGVTESEVEPFQSELFQVDEETERGQSPGIEDLISQIDKIVDNIQGKLQDVTEGGSAAAENEYGAEDQYGPEDQFAAAEDQYEPEDQFAAAGDQYEPAGEFDAKEDFAAAARQEEAAAIPREKRGEIIEKKTYNTFYNEYILNACAHACRVAEFYEDVIPFDRDKTGARWKKIINVSNLPLVSPGAHYFATQYRHYIFGAKPDQNGIASKFFFGIPGRFLDEEQPDGGKSGFTYWQPLRGADPAAESFRKGEQRGRNVYGYWIVAVDGKTGNIEEV